MPKTIDQMTEVTTLDGTEEVLLSQGGVTKKSLLTAIKELFRTTFSNLNVSGSITVTDIPGSPPGSNPMLPSIAGQIFATMGTFNMLIVDNSQVITQATEKTLAQLGGVPANNPSLSGSFTYLGYNNTPGETTGFSVLVQDAFANYPYVQLAMSDGTRFALKGQDGPNSFVFTLSADGTWVYVGSPSTPLSANDTGTYGEIRFDSNYMYRCIATNTWKRTALTTW